MGKDHDPGKDANGNVDPKKWAPNHAADTQRGKHASDTQRGKHSGK